MVPDTVKLCEREDFHLLSMDRSVVNEEEGKLLLQSFLALQQMEPEKQERLLDGLKELMEGPGEWCDMEVCHCQSHTCVLLRGADSLSHALGHPVWTEMSLDDASIGEDHIYLKMCT